MQNAKTEIIVLKSNDKDVKGKSVLKTMRSFDSTLQDDVAKADGKKSEVSKNVSSPIKNVQKNDSPLKDPPLQKVSSPSSSPNVGSHKNTAKNLSSTESIVSPPATDSPVKNVIKKNPNFATAKLPQPNQSQKIYGASPKMSPAPLELVDSSSNIGVNSSKSPPFNVTSPPPGPHLLSNKGNRKVEPHKLVSNPKEITPANSQDNSTKANLFKERSLSQEKECKSSSDTEQRSSIESGAIKSVKDIAKHVEAMQQPKDNGREPPKSNNKGASSVKSILTDPVIPVVSKSEEKDTEANGVGNKIKQFEKAAEGLNSRPGSIRRRSRSEQTERDSNQFQPKPDQHQKEPEMEIKSIKSNESTLKWRKDSIEYYQSDTFKSKFEQPKTKQDQKLPPQERGVLSPPSNVKSIHEQFSQPFTRNLQPLQAHTDAYQQEEEAAYKTNKIKKEKHCHKSNAYFTRGTEEIWLVKKKDIEEIEDRVLESFRRAGGNPDAFRPNADAHASFSSTLGRSKRPMYARSESSDPQWANTRAQTLKRQTSVACTCSHDKKNRPVKGNGNANEPPRPRSRSQGDDNSQEHVLDKYETLV